MHDVNNQHNLKGLLMAGTFAIDTGYTNTKVSASYSLRASHEWDSLYREGIDFNEAFAKTYMGDAAYHKHTKEKWLRKYTREMKKLKGIEKINMQRKIKSLKNQIDNHEYNFPEYYL